MLESDDDLVDTIKEMQEARGRGDKFNPRQLHEKIEVIGPAINLKKLTDSIDVQILDRLGVSWDMSFGMLQKFHKIHGHCRVPPSLTVDGFKLGRWTITQRHLRSNLAPEQVKRLNSVSFSWDPRSEQWEIGFSALKGFFEREGHSIAPQTWKENGFRLGLWVAVQRRERENISPERLTRLDSLNFVWNAREGQWEQFFAELKKFHAREGHCRVPHSFMEGKLKLSNWIGGQRQNKAQLTDEQISRLNSLGFSWDPHVESWENSFALLQEFHAREGHCNVPKTYTIGGEKLGGWVGNLRSYKERLTPNQIARLEAIGFSWNRRSDKWQQAFDSLQQYQRRHGHCRVNLKSKGETRILARWVVVQRRNKAILTPEQVSLLDSIGFSWDPHAAQWEEAFAELVKFHRKEGHCRVPFNLSVEGLNLGHWVGGQRQHKDRLTDEQIARLDFLGFSWDPHAEKWQGAFAKLKKFHEREGHCLVPRSTLLDGLKLGRWVMKQRQNFGKLSPDKLKSLNSLGFIWKP